jgi:hypothetical protein
VVGDDGNCAGDIPARLVERSRPDIPTSGEEMRRAFREGPPDVALLAFQAPPELPALGLVATTPPVETDHVWVVGFAGQERRLSYHEGEIVQRGPSTEFSASLAPGMSGAPVLARDGRVVGIAFAVLRGDTMLAPTALYWTIEETLPFLRRHLTLATPDERARVREEPGGLLAVARRLDGWAKGVIGVGLGYALLVVAMLLAWLVRPAVLARVALVTDDDDEGPRWRWWAEALTFARWLGGTERAMAAWLARHRTEILARGFGQRATVERRAIYVDLGNERDAAAFVEAVRSGRPAAFWLTGPGGAGKSTLAVELARRSRAERPELVPLLVEEDWRGGLLDHLGALLAVDGRRPRATMVRALARAGLVLPILDGLSERSVEAAAAELGGLLRSGAFRHLIITSRDGAPERGFHEVRIGPLEGERLAGFVRCYGSDETVVAALRRFTHGRPIRPLLARLAVDQMQLVGALPGSRAELIQEYVRALRPRGDGAVCEDDFLRAARLSARACVGDAQAPRAVTADYLRGFFAAEARALPFVDGAGREVPAARLYDQLLQCGLLQRSVERTVAYTRFSDDPIAEYLYVLAAVTAGPAAEEALRHAIAERGSEARGVAEALADVVPGAASSSG